MKIQRDWVTPLTIGVFTLMAVTGILMFFRIHRGLNGFAHEWLGWVMVVGVAGHALANLNYLKHHLRSRRGKAILGGFVVLLLLSFYQPPEKGDKKLPSYASSIKVLAEVPLSTVATLSGQSSEALLAKLAAEKVPATSDQQTVQQLVGNDLWKQIGLLNKLLPPAAAASAATAAKS
jgi:hypothetical protein